VTAGGTREPIDAVRFIGNRSSGRMGAAIAEAALARGATVTLVAANISVPLPGDVHIREVESTGQLRAAVLEALSGPGGRAGVDALIMAAAVADFTPEAPATARKLGRGEGLTLRLSPTPDILAEASRLVRGADARGETTRAPLRPRPVLVGFAAEAGGLDRVPGKLRRKQVDLVVANDVTEAGSGFGSETNRVVIFDGDGRRDALPLLSKREVADRILDRVAGLLAGRDAAVDSDAGSRQTDPASEEGTA
jgi:phosphopantothenoylcysteine decarboxylase/phosphopantothenate--cysteine ligase